MKREEIGTYKLWGDVFIDQSYPYNILSLHQAQEHGVDLSRSADCGIALVLFKDDKLHASKVMEYVR